MAAQNRTTNKSRFEDGDTATGSNFADLIDSFVSLADTDAQNVASDLRAANFITPGKVSAASLSLSTFQASTVSGADLVGSNLTSQTSARMAGTLNVVGITSVGVFNAGGAASFSGAALFASTVTLNAATPFACVSGAGIGAATYVTANNAAVLASAIGGVTYCSGFIRILVGGVTALVPFWRP